MVDIEWDPRGVHFVDDPDFCCAGCGAYVHRYYRTYEYDDDTYCDRKCAVERLGSECRCCGEPENVDTQGFCRTCSHHCQKCGRQMANQMYGIDHFTYSDGQVELTPFCQSCSLPYDEQDEDAL